MPTSVAQRAERVLNDISYALRDIQSDVYKAQDRIAQQTQKVYGDQKRALFLKPYGELLSLGVHLAVSTRLPKREIYCLNPAIPGLSDKERAEEVSKNKQEITQFLSRIIGTAASVVSDPANTAAQAELQKLTSGQQEASTLQNSLQTMIQTHDAAIQRLQNMEATARQGG